jgi:hypothetical protein
MSEIKYFGKLDQGNFYAFDMKCIGNCNQKSVIVLCGHKVVITLVLKNSVVDQQFCIKTPSTIEFLTANGHNTLCLDRAGSLCWFESTKKMYKSICFNDRIPIVNRFLLFLSKHLKRDGLVVKAVCAIEKNGFCEITSSGDGNLQLNVFEENDMSRVNQPINSFDLSWHECSKEPRSQEMYTLLHVLPSAKNKSLMEKLFNSPIANEVFVFSIDNTLMGLRYEPLDPSNYELVCMKVFAATVKRVWLSPTVGLLVLLESGVLEVLYVHKSMGLLEQRQNYFCSDLLAADLVENDIFVCLDGEILYQLNFNFSVTDGDLLCTTKELEFSGGLAFAYVKRERACFCITDNNLFYTVKIRRNDDDFDEMLDASHLDFMEVDGSFLRDAGDALTELRRATAIHKQTAEQKKQDCKTFQILNVFKNREIYAKFCRASVEIRPWLPTVADREEYTCFVPPSSYRSETLSHVVISLKVDSRVTETFNSSAWSVHISMQLSTTENFSYLFRVEKMACGQPLSYCLPFDHGDLLLLPQFEVELVAFVANGADMLKCSVPVAVASLAPRCLFSNETSKFSNVLKQRSIVDIVTQIQSRWSLKKHEPKVVNYTITLPQGHDRMLHSVVSTKQLFFFGHLVKLNYEADTRQLHIQSTHAGAIFYLKNLIYDRIFDVIDDDLSYTLPFQKHGELKAIELGLHITADNKNLKAMYQKIRDIAAFFEFN